MTIRYFMLTADAPGHAVGAVVDQLNTKGEREPLGFLFPSKLDETQQQWSIYDREPYAVYVAVEHFEYLIEEREVILATDYRPLKFIFSLQKNCTNCTENNVRSII